jgi:CRISPR-associated protein Csm3
MAKWKEVSEMKFEIQLLDGTRIGGAGGGLEIGGVDPNLMALKDPVSGQPYIPGSSLKGKLRSILEREYGLGQGGEPCGCGMKTCQVCPIFGAHKNTKADCGTSRLTVRDAHFTKESLENWKKNPILEQKTENIIDRNRGLAEHPRTQERVPAGAVFNAEIVLKLFDGDDHAAMIKNIKHALGVLQRFDALGSGGSRGSGRIEIKNFSEKKIALADVTL